MALVAADVDREKVIKPIHGYEGLYAVDNFANVYSVRRNMKTLAKQINPNGYCVDFAIVRDWAYERVTADYVDYGIRWRCWTSCPTDEQREAEPWNS